MAVTGYLKGCCHLSYTTLKVFFNDIMGIRVSRGFLAGQVEAVSESLKKPYEELAGQLPEAGHIHVDETGWKEKGKLEWVWEFRGALVTVFTIAWKRGSEVLEAVLGKGYRGIVSRDFWGAYKKYATKIAPLTFIDNEIPSTNNAAEQVIRAIVIDRKITRGTRSEWGARWMERFWSILTTCTQQGKPVIDFLYDCAYSGLNNLPSPSLLQS
jgi:hypothetical protein